MRRRPSSRKNTGAAPGEPVMVTGFLPIIRQFGVRVYPALTVADVFTGSGLHLQAVPRPGHSLRALRSRSPVLLEVLQRGRPP